MAGDYIRFALLPILLSAVGLFVSMRLTGGKGCGLFRPLVGIAVYVAVLLLPSADYGEWACDKMTANVYFSAFLPIVSAAVFLTDWLAVRVSVWRAFESLWFAPVAAIPALLCALGEEWRFVFSWVSPLVLMVACVVILLSLVCVGCSERRRWRISGAVCVTSGCFLFVFL